MYNIKWLFERTISCPNKWSYYKENTDNVPLYYYEDLFCDNCYSFIINYLQKGEKTDLRHFDWFEQLSLTRLQHTLSCFFLGINFYNHICSLQKEINKAILKIRPNFNNEDQFSRFKYIWMLICLFHDIGYCIEEKKIKFDDKSINKIIKDYLNVKLSKRQNNYVYQKKILKNYNKYRQQKFGIIDHGIIGGALLYKDLCELRKEKESLHHKNLYWGKELELDFYFAGRAIVEHNIYKITPLDNAVFYYKFFKIDKLISSEKIIKINKVPFLYLLCLIDTIDPIKFFNGNKFLDKILIDFKENSIIIDVSEVSDNIRFDYLGRIYDLNNWLTEVIIINNNCVKIVINYD